MDNVTTRLNNSLSAIWNIDDPIYQALISDINGTIPSIVNIPTDMNIGAIAGMLEYLRELKDTLENQIYMNLADTEFLQFTLNNYFGSTQLSTETNAQWLQRVISTIFEPKVSNAAIIYSLIPYSPGGTPTLFSGGTLFAFSDCSFSDITLYEVTTLDGSPFYVYPAYSQNTGSNLFFSLAITLYNTTPDMLATVFKILSKTVAAGIQYTVQIVNI